VKKPRILLYLKIGMKKPTFFLFFIVSTASFISKKIKKKQGFLRKSHQETYPRDPEKIHPGGKKAPYPGSATRIAKFWI
jgi:hypothetical protein